MVMLRALYSIAICGLFFIQSVAYAQPISADDLLALLRAPWATAKANDNRGTAISIGAAQLSALGSPDVALRLAASPVSDFVPGEIKSIIEKELTRLGKDKDVSIENISLKFDRQQIDLGVSITYSDANLTVSADIVGSITPAVQRENLLLPAHIGSAIIRSAQVRSAAVDTTNAVAFANAAIAQLIDATNTALTAAPPIKPIPLVVKPFEKIDLGEQLRQIKGVTQASGPTIDATAYFKNAVVLVTPDALEVISQLDLRRNSSPSPGRPPAVGLAPAAAEVDRAYERFVDAFHAARDRLTVPSGNPAIWIALSSDFLAKSVNDLFGRLDPPACATYNLLQPAPFNVRIKSFDGALPDCTPRISCDLRVDQRDCRRSPSCQHNHDARECSKCLVSLFGRCQARGNDPVCEAQKASQNAGYDAAYTACINSGWITDAVCEAAKGTQNSLYATEKLGCEANKSGLRLQCEALKELERQGRDLADVSSDNTRISGTARVCIGKLSLAPKLAGIDLSATLDANLSIAGDMHFTPLNIPGHLLGCVSDWRKPFSVNVTAASTSPSQSARVSSVQRGDALALRIDADEIPLEAQMRPGPFEAIFDRNPELVVVCPVLFGVGGTAKLLNAASVLSSGKDLIPELRGRFRHNAKVPVQELIIPAQRLSVGNSLRLTAVPHLESNAVVFTGTVNATP